MSTLEVNKVIPQSGTDLQLGESGDTITIPSGTSIALPDSSITNDQLVNDSITINGDVVALGGTTTIETGTAWQSSIVTAATLNAVSGNGYWINTTSNACTITLPASASVGDTIVFVDYARTWGTNAVTINTNSLNFQGGTANASYATEGLTISITYSGATQGWIPTIDDTSDNSQAYSTDFLVIAGGGGGGGNTGGDAGGGGGAGGYRTSTQNLNFGVVYTVTVGDGGAGGIGNTRGTNGSDSSVSGSGITTITSAGGGGGGGGLSAVGSGLSGGSGGGAFWNELAGNGNTPSTSPSQGNNGGVNTTANGATGGGGAGSAGVDNTSNNAGSAGGAGTASSITGSSVTRAGGGGGGSYVGSGAAGGTGGGGTGGNGSSSSPTAGTANLGGGGGGGGNAANGASGGKGVIILSMPDASYTGITTGSPTVATGVSGKTVLTFTGTGSYTA